MSAFFILIYYIILPVRTHSAIQPLLFIRPHTHTLSLISLFHPGSWGALVNSLGSLWFCLFCCSPSCWLLCYLLFTLWWVFLSIDNEAIKRSAARPHTACMYTTLTRLMLYVHEHIQKRTDESRVVVIKCNSFQSQCMHHRETAHTHTGLGLTKTMDLETISKAIFLWLLNTSIEKLIITHATRQQTPKRKENERRDNKRTDNKRKRWAREDRDKRQRKKHKHRYGLPGTDDQFVLAGVEGQLWVIHRALRLEPEDPRLHLCQRHHRTQKSVSQSERRVFTAAHDSCADELAAFKGLL